MEAYSSIVQRCKRVVLLARWADDGSLYHPTSTLRISVSFFTITFKIRLRFLFSFIFPSLLSDACGSERLTSLYSVHKAMVNSV